MRLVFSLRTLGWGLLAVAGYLLALYLLLPVARLSTWLQQDRNLPVSWQQMELRGGELLLHGVALRQLPAISMEQVRLSPHWLALFSGRLAGDLTTKVIGGDLEAVLSADAEQWRADVKAKGLDMSLMPEALNANLAIPVEGRLDASAEVVVDRQLQIQDGKLQATAPAIDLLGLQMRDGVLEGRWQQNAWVMNGKLLGDVLATGKLQATPDRGSLFSYRLKGSLDLQKGSDNPLVAQALPEGQARLSITGGQGRVRLQCVNAGQYCPNWVGLL